MIEILESRTVFDAHGFLVVSDFNGDSVARFDDATGAFIDTLVPKHAGGMNQPWGVLFGPDGNGDGRRDLYVSTGEFGGPGQLKAVLRYDGTTGAFIDRFATGGDLASPRGIIFGPDGNLYVADRKYIGRDWSLEGRVARFDGTTGQYLGDFVALGSGGLSVPTQLVFGHSVEDPGRLDLYVVSTGTHSVLRYHGTTGAFLGEFVPAGSGGLQGPVTMTFGPDGDLYVANFYSDDLSVKRFGGPEGQAPGTFTGTFVPAGSGGLRAPSGLIFGPDANNDGHSDLYLAEVAVNGYIKASVKRYDGVNGAFIDTFIAQRSGGLEGAVQLAFTETDPMTLAYAGKSALSAATPRASVPTAPRLVPAIPIASPAASWLTDSAKYQDSLLY